MPVEWVYGGSSDEDMAAIKAACDEMVADIEWDPPDDKQQWFYADGRYMTTDEFMQWYEDNHAQGK